MNGRREACAALLGAIAVPAMVGMVPDFDSRAERLNDAWNQFYRAYLGCPAGARGVNECKPMLGKLDRRAFAKARKAAARLFEFDDA